MFLFRELVRLGKGVGLGHWRWERGYLLTQALARDHLLSLKSLFIPQY